jgi:hypothetical protein
VFSVALAGGGIRGGRVHGASDKTGGQPKEGRVQPADLAATIFHCLGHHPDTEMHDTLGRPLAISRGQVIRQLFWRRSAGYHLPMVSWAGQSCPAEDTHGQ